MKIEKRRQVEESGRLALKKKREREARGDRGLGNLMYP